MMKRTSALPATVSVIMAGAAERGSDVVAGSSSSSGGSRPANGSLATSSTSAIGSGQTPSSSTLQALTVFRYRMTAIL